MEISTWRTRAGDLDVLVGVPDVVGLIGYEALRKRAVAYEFPEHTVHLACLADIVAAKRNAKRDRYLDALPELDTLLRSVDGR
jgi:hypothetical protein